MTHLLVKEVKVKAYMMVPRQPRQDAISDYIATYMHVKYSHKIVLLPISRFKTSDLILTRDILYIVLTVRVYERICCHVKKPICFVAVI